MEFGGLGLLSTMELDIISNAREFEVISNSGNLDSRAFRTRLSALEDYPLISLFQNKNHARDAVAKLARYGIYIRHEGETEINCILDKLGTQSKQYLPFTQPGYKDKCTLGIGLGKERNLLLMYGGPVHSILRMLQSNNWRSSESILCSAKPLRISIPNLLKLRNKEEILKDDDFANFCSFREWRNMDLHQIQCIPDKKEAWKTSRFVCPNRNNTHSQDQLRTRFRQSCFKKSRIVWETYVRFSVDKNSIIFNTYTWEGRALKFIMESKSPVIVATDGSHIDSGKILTTASSFVLKTSE